jgi:hypothetical protein
MKYSLTVRSAALVLGLLALAACQRPADSAFYNRGGPESLLDVSSEVVNLSVATPGELNQLSSWIEKDQPTRAELYCTAGDMRCTQAQKVLGLQGVPTMLVPSGNYSVALVYERILARDCSQRYYDDGSNNYNENHPAFGCSVAANIVQQVSDKQEFVSPNLSDEPLGSVAVGTYRRLYSPASVPPAVHYSIDNSVVSESKTGD